MKKYFNSPWLLLVVSFLLFPCLAQAHTGVNSIQGFSSGLIHPFGGLDHLCAMLAVGLWAAQLGGRAFWVVPVAFLSVMVLGGILGMMNVSLPLVEQGILASVFIMGILLAAAVRLPLVISVILVGAFALFHGHAHGAEMSESSLGVLYGAGFIVATALLHAAGMSGGVALQKTTRPVVLRWAGVFVIACGLYLTLA
ncbi:MAG: HupE/UreJ family protein [Blastochloris sp.]|nr:HupE/UreJ family protein [Blastochloris sp.]